MALAAAWRLDFAMFGGAAVLAVILLRRDGQGLRDAGTFALAAVAGTLAVYAPFLIAIGPADLYDALIGTSLRETGRTGRCRSRSPTTAGFGAPTT